MESRLAIVNMETIDLISTACRIDTFWDIFWINNIEINSDGIRSLSIL